MASAAAAEAAEAAVADQAEAELQRQNALAAGNSLQQANSPHAAGPRASPGDGDSLRAALGASGARDDVVEPPARLGEYAASGPDLVDAGRRLELARLPADGEPSLSTAGAAPGAALGTVPDAPRRASGPFSISDDTSEGGAPAPAHDSHRAPKRKAAASLGLPPKRAAGPHAGDSWLNGPLVDAVSDDGVRSPLFLFTT